MTDFKPGDRVRLSAAAKTYRRNGDGGFPGVGTAHGTVVKMNSFGTRVVVDWDNGRLEWNNPPIEEIELVSETTPEPIDPALAELRERLLDKAIKVADYNPSPESVLTFARAFESYILGDTK